MEWFKCRLSWEKSIQILTDEEAGRVMKGLMKFAVTGEEQKIGGREEILYCLMVETLKEDFSQLNLKTEKIEQLRKIRSDAGRKGAYAKHAKAKSAGDCQTVPDTAEVCHPLPEVASVCHDLPDKNTDYKTTDCQNTDIRDSEKEKEERDTDEEVEEEYDYSSEPPSADSEQPVIRIPLKNGTNYLIYRSDVDEYAGLYPAADVEQELRNMRGWCLANPTRQKTINGVERFINGWLCKAQDRGGRKPEVRENPFLAYARGEKTYGDWFE